MKGLFLQSKLDPRLVENKEYQQKTVDFLDRHSDLVDQKFWNNLNPTEKLKASRFLIFQEIEGDRNLRVSSKKDQAELFVVMHGNVIVKSQDTLEEVEYKQGEVFGAVDLFNVASENINDEHDVPKELDESRTMTVSTRNRGCYVRLSFSDYYKYVANNEVEEDLEAERKEFSKIAEIDYQLLTEEDKLCVESYKIAKKVLNKNLFLFMDAYKMIPRNARGPSSKYLMHGNLGREVVLKGSDARSIIVVLDGSVRLEIVAKRKISREHTIAYKRRGVKPMVINVR